jgi:uncharacterized RmlC-like cupin family protein
MKHLRLVLTGLNVNPLVAELARAPELWDDFTFRTESPISPHRDMSDIIVRYNDRKNYTNREEFNREHDAVWWDAYRHLPSVRQIVFAVMTAVEGERLGMVLITKLPPGKVCYPHRDGGWHASYYEKYAVLLQGNQHQEFGFEDDEKVSARPGDVYWFDNAVTHWVTNPTNEDRLTMIVCVRSDRRMPCPQVG